MNNKKILLLPFSRYKNPYQYILKEKLRKYSYNVFHGEHFPILPIALNYIKIKPKIIIIDWTHQWFLKKSFIITLIKSVFLLLEYFILIHLFNVNIVQNIHNKYHHTEKKYLLLQKLFLKILLNINKNIRFFSFKQRDLILNEYKISEKKNVIIIKEENKFDYFFSVKDKNQKNMILSDYALLFGWNRKNKQYLEFLKENWETLEWDKVIINDKNLLNDLIELYGKSKVESQILFLECPDSFVYELFSSIKEIILPYNNDVLNSGVYSMARDFKITLIITKNYFNNVDATLIKETHYTLDNQNLVKVHPTNSDPRIKYNEWENIFNAF